MEISGIHNYILDKKCPNCGGQSRISLSDIIHERIIICPTCHAEIRPVNAEEIAKEAKKKLDNITREVQDLLKNIKLEVFPH